MSVPTRNCLLSWICLGGGLLFAAIGAPVALLSLTFVAALLQIVWPERLVFPEPAGRGELRSVLLDFRPLKSLFIGAALLLTLLPFRMGLVPPPFEIMGWGSVLHLGLFVALFCLFSLVLGMLSDICGGIRHNALTNPHGRGERTHFSEHDRTAAQFLWLRDGEGVLMSQASFINLRRLVRWYLDSETMTLRRENLSWHDHAQWLSDLWQTQGIEPESLRRTVRRKRAAGEPLTPAEEFWSEHLLRDEEMPPAMLRRFLRCRSSRSENVRERATSALQSLQAELAIRPAVFPRLWRWVNRKVQENPTP